MPKKISVIISDDIIRQIEDSGLTQTEAVTRALDVLFSEDYQRIPEYKKKILEAETKNLILEARLLEFDTLKKALDVSQSMYTKLMDQQEKHVIQVQKLLNQRDDEIRLREDIILKKDEKIYLLEEKQVNKKWWKFWR